MNIPEQHRKTYEYAKRLIPVLPELPFLLEGGKMFRYIGVGMSFRDGKQVLAMLGTMHLLARYKPNHGWWHNQFSEDYPLDRRENPEIPSWWTELKWE